MRALVPNSFLPSFMAGEILLSSSGTYTVTLLTNTSAISDTTAEASWSTLSAVSAYVSSGASQKTLQNPRLVSDVSDIAYSYFTGDSVQWTSATFTTDAAVISDVNNKIIAIARYTEQVLSSETLTLNFNDLNGILRINNNELSITQHSHAIADVVGLTSALDNKADINHTLQSHYGMSSASPTNGQVPAWNVLTSAWHYVTPVLDGAMLHSSLLELGADDHVQYLTSGRADLVYSHLGHTHQTSGIEGLDAELSSISSAISTTSATLELKLDKSTSASFATSGHIHRLSVGCNTTPVYTDNGNGSITITDTDVSLFDNIDSSGLPKSYTIPGATLSFVNNETRYLVADYNSGSPIFRVISDVTLIDEITIAPILTVYRSPVGSELHILPWDTLGNSLSNKIHQSIVKTSRYRRESGLTLSESTGRHIDISGGKVWVGANAITVDAASSDTDELYYFARSGGNWVYTSGVTQYNNTQYSDGTNTHTLNNNRYAVNWIYRGIEVQKHIYMVLGLGDYSLQDAIESQPPSNLPPAITSHALLIGRIIVLKNATSATKINSAFDLTFTATGLSSITLQQAYNNSGEEPEIIVTDSLSIKNGTAADSNYVLDIYNTSGVQTAGILGDGTILSNGAAVSLTGHVHAQSDVTSSSGWITSALSGKEASVSSGTSGQYYRGDKTWQTLDKSAVGLSNVDNTGDLNKPISSAVQNALNLKQDIISSASSATFYAGDKSFKSVSYNVLSDVPSSFTPSSHQHAQSDVTSGSGWITSALAGKEAAIASGTTAQYYRGDKTWQTLDTKALSDVSSVAPSDGQALVYSSAVGKYVPGSVSTSSAPGTTDHHALTNLTTYDDHPQYLTSGRADLRYLTSASEIPQAQIVSASGWMSSALTSAKTIEDIVSTVDIGAITVGQSITSGTTITDFIKSLLMKTYYPTFSAPSAALTSNLASSVESGTLSNVTLTMTLNRGSILGKLVSGTWSSATQQDYRAGTATQYIISGTNTGTTNNRTISNYTVVDSTNTWSASVDYGVGPQPTDSLGANYSTPLSSGTLSNSVTVYGRRKAFYGTTSATDVPYTLSSEIRALSSSLLNPANGSTFTISIPVGAKMVVFAYPNTLQAVSSVKYVEGLNAEIKSIFNLTNINVEGLNGYSALSYKVYTYVPASPFSATATYNVTI